MQHLLIVLLLTIIVTSLCFKPEHFASDVSYAILTDSAKSAMTTMNAKKYNQACVLKTKDGRMFSFNAYNHPLDWYANPNKANSCTLDVTSDDINGDMKECSMNNAKLGKDIVANIYTDDAVDSSNRCVIDFKPDVTYEQLDAYQRGLDSYKGIEINNRTAIQLDNQIKLLAKKEKEYEAAMKLANEKAAKEVAALQDLKAKEEQAARDRLNAEKERSAREIALVKADAAKTAFEKEQYRQEAQQRLAQAQMLEARTRQQEIDLAKAAQDVSKQQIETQKARADADRLRQELTAPKDCVMGPWSGWSGCSTSCGPGTQTRTRQVATQALNGGKCNFPTSETQACNVKPCPVNCQVGGWSGWSGCSKSCGGGTQTRTRGVITQPSNGGQGCPPLQETQSCNTHSCQTNKTTSGCENNTASLNCPSGTVIKGGTVTYGYWDGRCGGYNVNPTYIFREVPSYVKGNNSYNLQITNGLYGDPLYGVYKQWNVDYTCG